MFKRIVGSLVLATALTAGANAATVSIEGPATLEFGQSATFSIIGDFGAEGLLAGGVQLMYDPSLITVDNFQTSLNVDTDLSCPGAALCPVDAAGTLSIVWGQFLSDLIPAGAGPTVMATVTITANGAVGGPGIPGTSPLDLVDFTDFTGGWFGAGFVTIPSPDFVDSSVQVVPLPAAVWFMIGGLGALAGFRRK